MPKRDPPRSAASGVRVTRAASADSAAAAKTLGGGGGAAARASSGSRVPVGPSPRPGLLAGRQLEQPSQRIRTGLPSSLRLEDGSPPLDSAILRRRAAGAPPILRRASTASSESLIRVADPSRSTAGQSLCSGAAHAQAGIHGWQ